MAFLAQLILGGLMVYLFFASLGFWFGLGVIVLWLLIGGLLPVPLTPT